MVNKIDSNFTGLRYTLEVPGTPKGLTGSEVWLELEPNSYSDFGGTTTLTKRTPIVANRMTRKGRTTDLDAKAGFAIDFTSDNMAPLMPTFFFAAWRKGATSEADAPALSSTGNSLTKTGAFASGYKVGSLILLSGYATPANNVLTTVSTLTSADSIDVAATLVTEASPPAAALAKVVGFKCASADVTIAVTDPTHPVMGSTVLDFTTLGLIPGQWIFIGGDISGGEFAVAGNNGLARISAIAAHALTFDKTQNTMGADAGTGKTVELFFADHIMNENDPELIVAQTIQFERSLSSAGFEYVEGSYSNTMSIEMKAADKVTMALEFQALAYLDVEFGARKTGTFPDIETDPTAYNTATDMVRIRASEQDSASPLFSFIQTMTIKIANNVAPLKALGVLGAFDVSVGDFDVTGDITAYFSDVAAIDAVRNADTLTVDWSFMLNNRGWVYDIPTLTFDKGTLDVVKDQAITIPVGVNAAEDNSLRTVLIADYFAYLPTVAMP